MTVAHRFSPMTTRQLAYSICAIAGISIVHFLFTLGSALIGAASVFELLTWPFGAIRLGPWTGSLYALFLNSALWAVAVVGALFLRRILVGKPFLLIRMAAGIGLLLIVVLYGMPYFRGEGRRFPTYPILCMSLFAVFLLPFLLSCEHLPRPARVALGAASYFAAVLLILIALLLSVFTVGPDPIVLRMSLLHPSGPSNTAVQPTTAAAPLVSYEGVLAAVAG
jgi:hypothetical protein